MKLPSTLPVLLLSLLLCGCERSATVVKEPEKKVVTVAEMTPEEVAAKLEALYERTDEYKAAHPEELEELSKAGAKAFKKRMIEKVRAADHLVITEISDHGDFYESAMTRPDYFPDYEYAKVRLPETQRKAFQDALVEMDDSQQDVFAFCFTPHHRLDMVGADGTVSSMIICFECMGIRWEDGLGLPTPKGIYATLGDMAESAGLNLENDWNKMALERKKREEAEGKSR